MSGEAIESERIVEIPSPNTPIAVFGGVYSNYLALDALLAEPDVQEAETRICLGDLGAFGPHPNRVFPLLHRGGVLTIRGNYDDSIGRGLDDCQCGYTDPRDNYFARLSYRYTFQNTSLENREWMNELPDLVRFEWGGKRVLGCHGSPRRMNEFVWESTSSDSFLLRLMEEAEADVVLATHSGLHWHRELPGDKHWVNVGALGRPANDGSCRVYYAILDCRDGALSVQLRPLSYDHERLAREMRSEQLPREFIETIRSGWWTTCLEILPAKERLRGAY